MNKLTNLFLAGVVVGLASCASSMTPTEVNNTLPKLSKSILVSQAQAEEQTKTGKCKFLVRNRKYVAPIGYSTKDDLRMGAKGIDEWVKLDGGNAYVLRNYQWINVGDKGATQLHIEFDTMLCN